MSERLIKPNNAKKNIKTFAGLNYYSYICNVIKKQRLLIKEGETHRKNCAKVMKLNSHDYNEIAGQISEGENYVEYAKDNEIIIVECYLEIDGYVEDDYYNGTGAFIETSKEFYVENVESFNEEGDETKNNFSEDELVKLVV